MDAPPAALSDSPEPLPRSVAEFYARFWALMQAAAGPDVSLPRKVRRPLERQVTKARSGRVSLTNLWMVDIPPRIPDPGGQATGGGKHSYRYPSGVTGANSGTPASRDTSPSGSRITSGVRREPPPVRRPHGMGEAASRLPAPHRGCLFDRSDIHLELPEDRDVLVPEEESVVFMLGGNRNGRIPLRSPRATSIGRSPDRHPRGQVPHRKTQI